MRKFATEACVRLGLVASQTNGGLPYRLVFWKINILDRDSIKKA
jgi:hypothetical protein